MIYISEDRVPASLLLAAHYLLATDVDFSVAGLTSAKTISEQLSGVRPNIVLCSPLDINRAKDILGNHPELDLGVWSRGDFENGYWLVGNFEAPTFFVGSPGS